MRSIPKCIKMFQLSILGFRAANHHHMLDRSGRRKPSMIPSTHVTGVKILENAGLMFSTPELQQQKPNTSFMDWDFFVFSPRSKKSQCARLKCKRKLQVKNGLQEFFFGLNTPQQKNNNNKSFTNNSWSQLMVSGE